MGDCPTLKSINLKGDKDYDDDILTSHRSNLTEFIFIGVVGVPDPEQAAVKNRRPSPEAQMHGLVFLHHYSSMMLILLMSVKG